MRMEMFALGPAPYEAGPATCPESSPLSYSVPSGKTLAAILDPSKTTLVLLVLGQSNAISIAPSTSFSPTAGTENFNFFDGLNYVAADPLLGTQKFGGVVSGANGGSFATRLGSKMIDAGMAQRVVLVNCAVSATIIADWVPGGLIGYRLRFVLRRMLQAGLRPSFICQTQGESDAIVGTAAATYAASVRQVVQTVRDNGSSAPYFISRTTVHTAASGGNQTIVRQGQVDALSGPLGIFAGPDTDALDGTYRQDGTHFSDTGVDAVANLWLATLQAWVAANPAWPILL